MYLTLIDPPPNLNVEFPVEAVAYRPVNRPLIFSDPLAIIGYIIVSAAAYRHVPISDIR